MDKKAVVEVVTFLKESYLKAGIQINGIALFGSALSDQMNEDSDLDLIVISPAFRNLDLFQRAKISMHPETKTMKKFNIPMDIINLSPEEYAETDLTIYHQNQIIS
jgi:uncharacterized protein